MLEVDAAAFHDFWRFDALSLVDALRATPAASFKMAIGRRRNVVGYIISGRSAERGFVQRLAVHPGGQGGGTGRRLLLDGMRWMAAGGARVAFVNTQPDNSRALDLYASAGFVTEPIGLSVLSVGLN